MKLGAVKVHGAGAKRWPTVPLGCAKELEEDVGSRARSSTWHEPSALCSPVFDVFLLQVFHCTRHPTAPVKDRCKRGLRSSGRMTKIDQSAGKITLKHGPMEKFNMDEGMTMVYHVQDPALLSKVKVGDKVQFDADQINGVFTVTKMQRAK